MSADFEKHLKFEPGERFKGCPPICLHANLPTFNDGPSAKAFNQANGGDDIVRKWKCHACGGYHYWTRMKPPSGSTSGTGRHSEPPAHIEALVAEAKTYR